MSKKLKGLAVTAIAAGAYAYLKDPENRKKVQEFVSDAKEKVTDFVDQTKEQLAPEATSNGQHHEESLQEKTGNPDPYDISDNEMVSEGAQTSVQYYGEEVEDDSDTDGLYHKHLEKEEKK